MLPLSSPPRRIDSLADRLARAGYLSAPSVPSKQPLISTRPTLVSAPAQEEEDDALKRAEVYAARRRVAMLQEGSGASERANLPRRAGEGRNDENDGRAQTASSSKDVVGHSAFSGEMKEKKLLIPLQPSVASSASSTAFSSSSSSGVKKPVEVVMLSVSDDDDLPPPSSFLPPKRKSLPAAASELSTSNSVHRQLANKRPCLSEPSGSTPSSCLPFSSSSSVSATARPFSLLSDVAGPTQSLPSSKALMKRPFDLPSSVANAPIPAANPFEMMARPFTMVLSPSAATAPTTPNPPFRRPLDLATTVAATAQPSPRALFGPTSITLAPPRPPRGRLPWTPDEVNTVLRERAAGKSFAEIAKLVGRTEAACTCRHSIAKTRPKVALESLSLSEPIPNPPLGSSTPPPQASTPASCTAAANPPSPSATYLRNTLAMKIRITRNCALTTALIRFKIALLDKLLSARQGNSEWTAKDAERLREVDGEISVAREKEREMERELEVELANEAAR